MNRWIVPLEMRHDFLTLSTGKKLQVPFDQLVIFSTNLEPRDLVDEAFLRRIPFKIEIGDPSEDEFHMLFQLYCRQFRLRISPRGGGRPAGAALPAARPASRRCHARDLLLQILRYCNYARQPVELRAEYFDRAVKAYFATVLGET